MCGATGEVRLDGRTPDVAAVSAMAEAMAPRGPDGAGVWSQGRVALGHRRLKIIDLSEAGAQPMVDADLGLAIALERLHLQLQEPARGADRARATGSSPPRDTEVLLKAYHQWGDRFVDQLHGHVRLRDRRAGQRPGGARARPAGHQAALHHRRRARACGSPRRCRRCWPAAASTPASTPSRCTTT